VCIVDNVKTSPRIGREPLKEEGTRIKNEKGKQKGFWKGYYYFDT